MIVKNSFDDDTLDQIQKLWNQIRIDTKLSGVDQVLLWDSFIRKIAAVSQDAADRIVASLESSLVTSAAIQQGLFKPVTLVTLVTKDEEKKVAGTKRSHSSNN